MSEYVQILDGMIADADISAAIGTNLFYMRLPQEFSGNGIVCYALGGIPKQMHPGVSACKNLELQVNIYGSTVSGLETTKAAVIAYFNTLQGTVGSEYVLNATLEEIDSEFYETTNLYRTIFQISLQMRN